MTRGPLPDFAALYAGLPTGHDTSVEERRSADARAGTGTATYGEITVAGAARLLRWFAPTPTDMICDLGSGTGKFILQAASTTDVGLALGIEISPHRHAVAVAARARLAVARPETGPRVRLELADFAEVDLSAVTLAFACSLTYPASAMAAMGRALARAPRLRALVTLKPLLPPWPRILGERGQLRVETSWNERERAFVYGR